MDWLTPTTGLLAAAVTVPLLVLLYFLKLRRQVVPIGSTLLWQRAVKDLRVNAPFQRLRRNLLLLLQLLALAAVLLALAGPVLWQSTGPGRRYVLLIDRSASMQTVDAEGVSRLDRAKKLALQQIESLRTPGMFQLSGQADEAMVVTFDDRARVVCNFTSDMDQLRVAISSIEASDAGSRLDQALQVAGAYAKSSADGDLAAAQPTLVLLSDGQIEDLGNLPSPEGDLAWQRVEGDEQNVGITAMEARRNLLQNDSVQVFATVSNPGEQSFATKVQLRVGEDIVAVRNVSVPPAKEGQAGQLAVQFEFSSTGAAILEVRLLTPDALPVDNAAWAVVPSAQRLRVLLVSEGSLVLSKVIQTLNPAQFDQISPEEFASLDRAQFAATSPYDVVVLDNVPSEALPMGRFLTFGTPPAVLECDVAGVLESQPVIDWRSGHAVLDSVALNTLYVSHAVALTPPRGAEVLAEFAEAPAILETRTRERHAVVVAFDPLDSNWPFEGSFVLFFHKALHYLAADTAGADQTLLRVGDPLERGGLPPGQTVTVMGPQGDADVVVGEDGTARFAGTDRVGVYQLRSGDTLLGVWAVNLLRSSETDVHVPEELHLRTVSVAGQDGPAGRANVPLWPWLVLAALGVVCVEWFVYNSRVRL